jgi:hypothetical protein
VTTLDGRAGDFVDHVITVLIGIAMRRGEAWQPLLELRADSATEPTGPTLHP